MCLAGDPGLAIRRTGNSFDDQPRCALWKITGDAKRFLGIHPCLHEQRPLLRQHGNHSESDAFVKSQLAVQFKMSESFKHTLAQLKQAKKEAGGKNYFGADDAAKLILEPMFYPQDRIQEFTYSIAKRRSRNRWPSVVAERLESQWAYHASC